jgi:hypothetical protein
MNTSKHTLGPWIARTHSVTGNRSLFSPQATCTVAQLVDCHDSDAALIAAAPELLEALKAASETIHDLIGQEAEGVAKLCREVIAKAEGRS